MLVVIALGGGQAADSEPMHAQRGLQPFGIAARAVAAAAREHSVVVAHSSRYWPPDDPSDPFRLALESELPERQVVRVAPEVVVQLEPFGPRFADTPDGHRFAAQNGWTVVSDGSGFFRQARPTPVPKEIVQLPEIRALIARDALLICLFVRGLVIREADFGIEEKKVAVQLNSDLAAALLAELVGADLLMLLADVEHVEVDWRAQKPTSLGAATVEILRSVTLAPASVASKVDAGCRFVEMTGKHAAIGAVAQAAEVLAGDRGIQISAS